MIQPPSEKTLSKYGLTARLWLDLLEAQGGVCAVCKQFPKSGKFNIDHDHVKGWRKLPAELRRLHVRGILCWFCNTYYVGRAITIEKSRAVTAHLEQHRERMIAYAITEAA